MRIIPFARENCGPSFRIFHDSDVIVTFDWGAGKDKGPRKHSEIRILKIRSATRVDTVVLQRDERY